MDYKTAGVDIEAGYKSVELMKKHVKETMRPEVLGGLGGFAGAFDLSGIKNMEEPVLLSGTDGCGTKVKLAFVMDKLLRKIGLSGRSIVPMFVMMIVWCGVRVTYISIVIRIIPVINVIYWAYPLTWFISSVIFLILFLKTDWIHGLEKQ